MIPRLSFLALVARQVLAAPANLSQPQIPVGPPQNASEPRLSSYTGSSNVVPATSTLPAVLTTFDSIDATSSQVTSFIGSSSTIPVASFSSLIPTSHSSSSALLTLFPTSNILATEVVTAFETTTVNATPSSFSIFTVLVTTTATATVTSTGTTATTQPPSWENRTFWTAPPQMTDLSAFNITYFPSGQRNLHLIAQIPDEARSPIAKYTQDDPFSSFKTTPLTVLQLVYPAHSVNPGSKPEGGADFYATPLNLTGARNVTLTYSVFFPVFFNWVKGGKLPGLFGGHTGCSGGASARDCFSTRIMWRPRGAGELYLYAPKDKQSDALCADVKSVCDTTYGFSVGRGTFNFTAGDWTHLTQNVVLNTPGTNDGVFTLIVDRRLVINRTDIFYRDVARLPQNQPAEFLGLFFSTFFGGHGKAYATPNQQYTWFKDFAITRHD